MNSLDFTPLQVKSLEMSQILTDLKSLSNNYPVFIIGKKGSGKTTLAHFIQQSVLKNSAIQIFDSYQYQNGFCIYTLTGEQWTQVVDHLKKGAFTLIQMPTLQQRRLDIPDLADFCLQVLSLMHNKPKVKLTEKALEKILQYKWPGQFYEFESVLESAFMLAENGLIEPEFLAMGPLNTDVGTPIGMKLEELERKYILQTLYFVHQNRTKAAEILGISIRTLRNKINQYRIEGHL